MSDITPGPDHAVETPTDSFVKTSRKALAAGVSAAIPATGAAVAAAAADGNVDTADLFAILGVLVSSFFVAFGITYRAPNAPRA